MKSQELIYALREDREYLENTVNDLVNPIRDELIRQIGFELRPYQKALSDKIIHETLRQRNEEIAVLWARQVGGKTETLTLTVLTLLLFYLNIPMDFRVGWFAPAQSQSIQIARRRIVNRTRDAKTLFDDLGVELVKGYGRERVGDTSPLLIFRNNKFNTECHIRSLSANPKSNIKGDTLHLTIIEDAQEVDETKMKTDIYEMASTGGPILLVGVPIPNIENMNQYFIETLTKNPRNAYVTTADWLRCCGLDDEYPEEAQAYERGSNVYRMHIDKNRDYVYSMRDKLREDSKEFQSQFTLKWFAGESKLISLEDVMRLEMEYVPNLKCQRFWGLDIAKVFDSTVGIILERYLGEHNIIGIFEEEGTDYPTQARNFLAFLKKYTPLRYGFIDMTGGGELFIDTFKELLYKEPRENINAIGSWDGFDFRGREEVNRMNQIFCTDLLKGNIHFHRKNLDNNDLNKLIEQYHTVNRVYHGHYLWLEAPSQNTHDDYPVASALARYASEEKSQRLGIVNVNI